MYPLTLDHLLWRMRMVHPGAEVVTAGGTQASTGTGRNDDGAGPASGTVRCSFEQLAGRIEALALGLRETIGLAAGETVTVLGWNDQHHLELLLAVPLAGARVNSTNLRVGAETLAHLAGRPLPRAVVVDSALYAHPAVGANVADLVGDLRARGVTIVAIGDGPGKSEGKGKAGGDNEAAGPTDQELSVPYESLITPNLGRRWDGLALDENSVAFTFHTSGTTGLPKSYTITHRAAMLHCLSQATVDASGVSQRDRVMPLAPFFHVNGWGLPLTCILTGASLVLVGGDLNPARVARVMQEQNVSVAAAVPTVWYDVCAAIERGEAVKPGALREVLTGGSPLSETVWRMIVTTLGAGVATAWGMTETMACSTYERERPHERAGKPIPLVELMVDDGGATVSGAGAPRGRLKVRGPFVVAADGAEPGNWFATGDIATIDAGGSLTLRDRENDLIKSGGEWIASAEIEQHLCTHPDVLAAVVVPTHHPKWVERPLAYVVLARTPDPGETIEDTLTAYLARAFPRWWLPDNIVIVDEMPTTAVGKIDKRTLRKMAESEKEKV